MFLVDTDVISIAAPTKVAPPMRPLDWLKVNGNFIYLSAITLAEIRRGIALISAKGHDRKARHLMAWQESLVQTFADRILPVDGRVARRAGDLLGAAEANGLSPGLPDACIAATADINNLVLITGNGRHFRALGIVSQTPWERGDVRS